MARCARAPMVRPLSLDLGERAEVAGARDWILHPRDAGATLAQTEEATQIAGWENLGRCQFVYTGRSTKQLELVRLTIMRAMVFEGPGRPLAADARSRRRRRSDDQLLIRVSACAVCRTDLHIVDGELPTRSCRSFPDTRSSAVVEQRAGRRRFAVGDRVGVPWLGWTCGVCAYCRSGRENLCDRAALHRLSARRRIRRVAVADAALLLPAPRRLRRRRGGAAALRRAHRLSRVADGRRRASGSASTASARPPTSSRRSRAHEGREVYAFTRPGEPRARRSRARSARSGRAARTSRRPSRSTPRSSSRRSARSCRRRSRGRQGRTRRLRAAST